MKEHDQEKCSELMAAMAEQEKGMSDKLKLEDGAAIEKRLAELEKRATDAEARAKAAEESVAKAQEQREVEFFIAKAAGFAKAGITPDDAALLRKAYKVLEAKEQERLDALFRGMTKIAEDSALFGELGRSGSGIVAGSTWEKMEQMAKQLVEKSASERLTTAQAHKRLSESNAEYRALERQYHEEQREAARRVR